MEMRGGRDRGPADPFCLSHEWVQSITASREAGHRAWPSRLPSRHYKPHWPWPRQHRSYDSTPLPDSPRPPSLWSLRDLFSAQTQTHWGSDCPGQEELPRLLLCSQPTGLMCWGQRGHHHLGSQAHTSTYMSSASLQRTLLRMLNSKDRERHWECWQVAGLRASSLGLCRPSPSSRLPLGSLRRSLACGPVSCGGV